MNSAFMITSSNNCICFPHPSIARRSAFLVSFCMNPASIAAFVSRRISNSTGRSVLMWQSAAGIDFLQDVSGLLFLLLFCPAIGPALILLVLVLLLAQPLLVSLLLAVVQAFWPHPVYADDGSTKTCCISLVANASPTKLVLVLG